jgi:outer membrane biosynthesis protein TonB
LLSPPADLKLAVGGYASTVRSFLTSRVREYLVRHPKLPAQAGLIASIVVAAVIVGHYVGRIDVVSINQVPSQPSAPAPVAPEPLNAETPAPTPIPSPAVERQPADRTTDVRNTQLAPVAKAPEPMPPPAKAQLPKAQRSTIAIANANSSPRRTENPRPREVERETQTALQNSAAAPVIAPPSSVSSAAPLVAASARPTAVISTPASPAQPATGSAADFESPGPVYSAQDIDVRPPQMLDADLPRPAVMNWPTVKNSMELLVTADGSVERVKWLTSRERMPDVMLLSRAKLWKFSPAVRDGQPVRYRLIVTWEVNP